MFRKRDPISAGMLAPDFSLADTSGKTVRLSQHRGQKHVVLVFLRGFL